MIPILDSGRMRAADDAAIRGGIPSLTLMENAATGVARAARERFTPGRPVVVLCGPGNNGGDGLAVARMLRDSFPIRVFTLGDPAAYRGDAAVNADRARAAGLALESLSSEGELSSALAEADGAVDALFGTGLDRPLDGLARRAVEAVNRAGVAVVAADVPSGLSSDTGALIGDSIRAAETVAFGAPKICHALPPARRRCGRLVVHDIGIPHALLESDDHDFYLATADVVSELLPRRDPGSHKGDFGHVAIVAGSRGKAGAAVLAARGALRGGAGLVTVFCPESIQSIVVTALAEAMTQGLPERDGTLDAGADLVERLADFDSAVVGPGLGTAPHTVRAVEQFVAGSRLPIVLDADGLNAFAGRPAELARHAGPLVATPHPGEAGRLLSRSAKDVQADRLGSARELARLAGCCVLLKGEASLTATPDGRIVVNSSGTPLLATAGSGDVLSGLIATLLASGLSARDASVAGAWLHGKAGERLAERLGDAGLLAHEVADQVPRVRRELGSANG